MAFYLKRYTNIDRLIQLIKNRNNIRLERNTVVAHDIPSNYATSGALVRFFKCTQIYLSSKIIQRKI